MFILSISENILFFIAGIGTLQGILLAALLYFHPKADKTVNLFLALYIFCLSIIMTTALFYQILPWQNTFFLEPFPWMAGPLLYLYVRSFKEKINWRKAWPHILPFFILFFISYLHFTSMARQFPGSKTLPPEVIQHPATLVFILIRYIQMLFYNWLGRRTLSSYQRSLKQLYSETTRMDPGWIRWLLDGYLIAVLFSLIMFGLIVEYPSQTNLWLVISVAIVTPYIYLATFKGISQPTLWQTTHGVEKQEVEKIIQRDDEVEKEKPKYHKASVSDEKTDEIINRILAAMELEKLYQETELTLQEMAEKVQAPAYQVSQAINEKLNKSFYDLINSYRVEEAKRLLHSPDSKNFTILSVGFEAGFNSKTTFNTVFKKFTGLTPSEFRNQQKVTVTS